MMVAMTVGSRPPLRWGILGTAQTAWKRTIPAIQRTPGQKVVAIAGREQRKLALFHDRFSIPLQLEMESLLLEPTVDAVYIPLPNSLHSTWTIKALQAGKHVLCEKPIALRVDELEDILEAQSESGCLVEENLSYGLSPAFELVRTQNISETLGRILSITVFFGFNAEERIHKIRFERRLGGGSFLDLGCYGIDFVHRFLEESIIRLSTVAETPTAEQASWGSGKSEPVDAACTCVMTTASGVECILRTSFTGSKHQIVFISGEEGSCTLVLPFRMEGKPTMVTLQNQNGAQSYFFEEFDQDRALLLTFGERIVRTANLSNGQLLRWRQNAKWIEAATSEIFRQLDGDSD
jgi:predicted dehydrogenase